MRRPDGPSAELPEQARAEAERREMRDRNRPMEGGAPSSWQDIKGRFVDDPAGALAAAEQMVRSAVEDKMRALNNEANAICARDREEEDASSTETMRTRLIRYQEYCERLSRTSH